ncbi:MAG: hypothetical protein IPO58_17475 [Betaproteobacteria bacterium]|nr:hypothetical protein [Betaproteobacteria bacterium]
MNKFSWSTFAGLSPAAAESPALGRFVFLSLLLHFLLVVLFGNTTGTGTAPGAYLSMPLGVRLRPLSAESGAGLSLAPAPEASSLGAALLRTLTGAKQQPAPRRRTETRPAPTVPQRPAANRVEAAPESPPAAQPTRDAAPAAQAPPVDPQPGMNFSAPEVVDRPLKPSSITPPPVERPPAPPVDLPARDVPVLPPAPIERVIAPKIEQPIVPPTAPAPREVPRTPAPAAERIAPRTIEPAPQPAPVPLPREVPAASAPPIAPVAPPKPEPPLPPAAAPPRTETPTPAPVERVAPPDIAPAIQPAPASGAGGRAADPGRARRAAQQRTRDHAPARRTRRARRTGSAGGRACSGRDAAGGHTQRIRRPCGPGGTHRDPCRGGARPQRPRYRNARRSVAAPARRHA